MRFYVAGPMTGYENYNFDEFERVGKALAEMGHEVYNPATSFKGRQDLPYDLYLRHALQMVTMVDGIVLLGGWTKSRGALTEVHAGLSCDLKFYNLREDTLIEVEMNYGILTAMMYGKYVEDADATISSVSEGHSGHPRQAEGREDYTLPSTLIAVPAMG